MNTTLYLSVMLGAALGASTRVYVSMRLTQWLPAYFSLGTVCVNALGSFVIGFLVVVLREKGLLTTPLGMLAVPGFLGAFTTFSTFSLDTWRYIEQGRGLMALLNVGVTVVVCLVLCYVGMAIAKSVVE